MPINANLGNVSYVLCAVTGAIFALNGYLGLTLGTLVSFLTLNKNSTQPVSQISQQLNSIVMAMAGAQRIFDLMDEEPEEDDGYVREEPDGTLTETQERTNLWAWKHPHRADGTVTYQKLEGDITFVIAHRLSTVRNSDCIMVLEQGRIIERGTHDQLIAEKGRYYQLYTGNAIGA